MRRRMERFADLARRKAFSRWSATWIAWRKRWASRRTNCGGGISFIEGETLAVGQVVNEKVDMDALDGSRVRAERLSREAETLCRGEFCIARRDQERDWLRVVFARRGIYGFGRRISGIGSGDGSDGEGRVHVLAGSTEMGQGTNTIFAQIAAEALRLDCEQIEIVQPDTAHVPNSGPTVASRTAMIVGKLVETAALGLQKNTASTANCCSIGYERRRILRRPAGATSRNTAR